MKSSILVVDNEESICKLISEAFHEDQISISLAGSGCEALKIIEEQQPRMVVCDATKLIEDDFRLLKKTRKKHPCIKHLLMTASDIDSCISLVRRHSIGNILVKGSDFSLFEIKTYIKSLIEGSLFGLDRYFREATMNRESITSYSQARELCSKISLHYPGRKSVYLEIAIDELISNAIFHAVLQLTGVPRERWSDDHLLEEKDAVVVMWAVDGEKVGVSVEDPRGNLKKVDVLHWLESANDFCPRGSEEHGRGLVLIRKLIDRFIINIDPGKRTECVILQYFNKEHLNVRKPLLIHELTQLTQ